QVIPCQTCEVSFTLEIVPAGVVRVSPGVQVKAGSGFLTYSSSPAQALLALPFASDSERSAAAPIRTRLVRRHSLITMKLPGLMRLNLASDRGQGRSSAEDAHMESSRDDITTYGRFATWLIRRSAAGRGARPLLD